MNEYILCILLKSHVIEVSLEHMKFIISVYNVASFNICVVLFTANI